MPNNNVNELARAVTNAISNLCGSDTSAARRVAQAINDGLCRNGLLSEDTSASCGCPQTDSVKYNPMRKLVYMDAPGFSDESLTVTLKSRPAGDVIAISASNNVSTRRPIYKEIAVTDKCGCGKRVDRSTLSASLRLGVLTVKGRTYQDCVPEWKMNLCNKTIRPVMKPNRG